MSGIPSGEVPRPNPRELKLDLYKGKEPLVTGSITVHDADMDRLNNKARDLGTWFVGASAVMVSDAVRVAEMTGISQEDVIAAMAEHMSGFVDSVTRGIESQTPQTHND